MIKIKKGFALLVTLSVLSAIISLTIVLLSYFNRVQKDATKTQALLQATIYYSNIVNILNTFPNKKVLITTLYKMPMPLYSDKTDIFLNLYCEPLANGVNINWLKEEENPKNKALYEVAQELFDFLVQEYEIRNPSKLFNMILEHINKSQNSNWLVQRDGINSFSEFKSILENYAFNEDDKNVLNVNWEKYFSFSSKSLVIDAEYASNELISFLFDISKEDVSIWKNSLLNPEDILNSKTKLKDFVEDNGGNYNQRKAILANEKFIEESLCGVRYSYADNIFSFKFQYIKGETKYFEFIQEN